MTKVLGIVNIEPTYVHVEGIEDYRPISATSFMGRYRVIDFILSNLNEEFKDASEKVFFQLNEIK